MYFTENTDPVKQEFINYLEDNIVNFLSDRISDESVLSIQEVVKGNDQKLTGVSIHEPGNNISPTIYIDEMVEEYRNGADLDVLMARIADVYMDHRNPEHINFDVSKVTDFENVKEMLVTKVVNSELSSEFLSNVPHKEFGDLSVFCQIRLDELADGSVASITVKDDILEKWDVSFDEVMEIATSNDVTITEPKLVPMQALITGMMYGDEYEQEGFLPPKEEEPIPMFVLQTSDKYNGAKLLNQPELMEQIAEFLDSDFIVLPSSIHEAIIIPCAENSFSMMELGQMVQDVNGSEVKPEEILSDHAYMYSKAEKVLTFEKDGEQVTMKFTKEVKKALEEPKKEGIKAKLKEGIDKSKAQDSKPKTPKKEKEEVIA